MYGDVPERSKKHIECLIVAVNKHIYIGKCMRRTHESFEHKFFIHVQWNPVNTDTKGTSQIVRINGVSVLSGFSEKVTDTCFIDTKTAKKRCLIVL